MDTSNVNTTVTAGFRSDSPRAESAAVKNRGVETVDTVVTDPAKIVHDLERAVDVLNEALSKDPVALQFRIDETLNRPVVSVISEETGEIVHQLPKEEVLRAVKNLDVMRGILFEGEG